MHYMNNLNRVLLKPRIKNLCNKVGIKNINSLVYEEMRGVIKVFLEDFLERILIITKYYQKKTITVNSVYLATEEYLLLADKIPKCEDLNKKFKACLEFPKSPFLALIKEISNDFGVDNIAVQQKAAELIQYYTERYAFKILKDAKLFMLNAKRDTLYPKDIKFIKKVSENS